MKIKIFFKTLGFPMLLAAVILWPPVDRLSVRLFLLIAIMLWLLVTFLTSKRTYLSGLSIENDHIDIEFLTAQLVIKRVRFNVDDVSGIQVSRASFPYDYIGAVRVYAKGEYYTFLALENKQFEMAQQATAVNASLLP